MSFFRFFFSFERATESISSRPDLHKQINKRRNNMKNNTNYTYYFGFVGELMELLCYSRNAVRNMKLLTQTIIWYAAMPEIITQFKIMTKLKIYQYVIFHDSQPFSH